VIDGMSCETRPACSAVRWMSWSMPPKPRWAQDTPSAVGMSLKSSLAGAQPQFTVTATTVEPLSHIRPVKKTDTAPRNQ